MIDRKYEIEAHNKTTRKKHTEQDSVLFLAKDKALPFALEAYIRKCIELGCDKRHLESATLLLDRVRNSQKTKVDTPDTSVTEAVYCNKLNPPTPETSYPR